MSDRRFATLHRAAQEHGVSYYTVRNYIKRGYFPVYRLPGQRAACVDLNEMAEALRSLPAAKAKPGYASFGPDAVVRDLSNVVGEFDVEGAE